MRSLGPVEQGKPAGQAQCNAKRVLVRRRDDRHAGVPTGHHAPLDIDSFGIDRDRDGSGPGGEQGRLRTHPTRILDPHTVPGIKQNPDGEVQSLLRSVDDDDLVRLAPNRPRARQMSRDRLAQRPVSGRRAVSQQLVSGRDPPRARHETSPVSDREEFQRCCAGTEGTRPSGRQDVGDRCRQDELAPPRRSWRAGWRRHPAGIRQPRIEQVVGQ